MTNFYPVLILMVCFAVGEMLSLHDLVMDRRDSQVDEPLITEEEVLQRLKREMTTDKYSTQHTTDDQRQTEADAYWKYMDEALGHSYEGNEGYSTPRDEYTSGERHAWLPSGDAALTDDDKLSTSIPASSADTSTDANSGPTKSVHYKRESSSSEGLIDDTTEDSVHDDAEKNIVKRNPKFKVVEMTKDEKMQKLDSDADDMDWKNYVQSVLKKGQSALESVVDGLGYTLSEGKQLFTSAKKFLEKALDDWNEWNGRVIRARKVRAARKAREEQKKREEEYYKVNKPRVNIEELSLDQTEIDPHLVPLLLAKRERDFHYSSSKLNMYTSLEHEEKHMGPEISAYMLEESIYAKPATNGMNVKMGPDTEEQSKKKYASGKHAENLKARKTLDDKEVKSLIDGWRKNKGGRVIMTSQVQQSDSTVKGMKRPQPVTAEDGKMLEEIIHAKPSNNVITVTMGPSTEKQSNLNDEAEKDMYNSKASNNRADNVESSNTDSKLNTKQLMKSLINSWRIKKGEQNIVKPQVVHSDSTVQRMKRSQPLLSEDEHVKGQMEKESKNGESMAEVGKTDVEDDKPLISAVKEDMMMLLSDDIDSDKPLISKTIEINYKMGPHSKTGKMSRASDTQVLRVKKEAKEKQELEKKYENIFYMGLGSVSIIFFTFTLMQFVYKKYTEESKMDKLPEQYIELPPFEYVKSDFYPTKKFRPDFDLA